MDPKQALQIIDLATQPVNLTKLTRQDLVNVDIALRSLTEFVEKHSAPPKAEAKKTQKK